MANDDPQDHEPTEEATENAVPLGTVLIETYEIQELISVGGMGEVYRGINMHTKDPVAIKIVLPALAHDPKISALFQKEAQVLGRLFHDSIVRYHIYTYDKGIGRPVLVMEFVSGESLTDHLDYGPMPEDEVRRLVRRLADGLSQAHLAGTVHRDLTPNNVILPGKSVDQAKIIDFGIAKTTAAGSGTVLQGQFAGTLNFVSPEQLGDFGGEIDGRSDIYSLGLLAAACCRGETIDMGSSVVEAVNARRGVPDISDVYPALRPILTAMLEPNPVNRPESMAKVIELLDSPPQEAAPPVVSTSAPPADRTIIAPMPSMPPAQPNVATTPPAGQVSTPPGMPSSTPPGMPASVPPSMPDGTTPPQSVPPEASVPPAPASTPPGIGQPAPGAAPQPSPQVTTQAPPSRFEADPEQKKRSPVMAILLVLLVLGGGAAGTYFSGIIPGFAPVPPNNPPVAQNDWGFTEFETTISVDVLENDTDPDGDELRVVSFENPVHGTASMSGGIVTFTPEPGFHGYVAFSYILADSKGAEASGVIEIEVAEKVEDPQTQMTNHLAFIAENSPQSCFFLQPTTVEPDDVEAISFASDQGTVTALQDSFKAERGASLRTTPKIINTAQCAALDFAKLIREGSSQNQPDIILDRDVLVSGQEIRGTVKGFKGKDMWLFLVDGDGGVYDISSMVELLGDDLGTFGLQIQLTAGSPPAPQVMMMVLTDTPVTTAKAVRNGSPAATLLPLVEQEFKAGNHSPTVAISYFRLEN